MIKKLSEMSNEELWKLFPIILSGYNTEWPEYYEKEKKSLIEIIGKEYIIRINHIGSTAVPGLIAKPTIDILLEIKENTNLKLLINSLEKTGYIYSPQPKNPAPHMLFMKGYTPDGFKGQAYHLHIRYAGDWNEIYFRNYLRIHTQECFEYGQLKQKLKQQYEYNRDAYTEAKSEFINRIIRLARKMEDEY